MRVMILVQSWSPKLVQQGQGKHTRQKLSQIAFFLNQHLYTLLAGRQVLRRADISFARVRPSNRYIVRIPALMM